MYRIGEAGGKQNTKIVKVMDILCFSEQESVCRIDCFVSDIVLL